MTADDTLKPWHLDELISRWDESFAGPLKFRVFTHKQDASDSRRRYARILDRNRRWLNAGRSTPLDVLHQELCAQLLIVGSWLADQKEPDDALSILGGPACRTMGFWSFARPDLMNLSILYGEATGQGGDVAERTMTRRREKGEALKRWRAAWGQVERKAALQIRDPQKLDALLPQVIEHLAAIERLIEQVADSW